MHALFEVHDTPVRALLVDPTRVGVGLMSQFVPFHASARVVVELVALSKMEPTALQAVEEVHDTLERESCPEVGRVWIVQFAPFHVSANGPPPVKPTW